MYRRFTPGLAQRGLSISADQVWPKGVPSESQTAKIGSLRQPRNFLRVGKDFTIPAADFLPVGKDAQSLPPKTTKRPDRLPF